MATISSPLPRITIQFCTQCKWMLRAAYFAQELLSTFNTAIGEVCLQPSTGGTFIVEMFYKDSRSTVADGPIEVQKAVLWDRKVEGGFPETKELKRRVRDIIQPDRDLGHVDGKKKSTAAKESAPQQNQGETHEKEQESAIASLSNLSTKEVASGDQDEDGIKRNADGSICEDCN